MNGADGTWNDKSCDDELRFICEVEVEDYNVLNGNRTVDTLKVIIICSTYILP